MVFSEIMFWMGGGLIRAGSKTWFQSILMDVFPNGMERLSSMTAHETSGGHMGVKGCCHGDSDGFR